LIALTHKGKHQIDKLGVKESMAETERQGVVYVGNKPSMSYVLATVLQFNSGCDVVAIKARGRAISKAVDVAEITRQKFLPGMVEVQDVKIGTEEIGEGENRRNVSVIEIFLRRKK